MSEQDSKTATSVEVRPGEQLKLRRASNMNEALHKVDRVLNTLRAVVSEAECRPTCSADVVQGAALRAAIADLEAVRTDLRDGQKEHSKVCNALDFARDASELPF